MHDEQANGIGSRWAGMWRCSIIRNLAVSVAFNALLCALLVLGRYVASASGACLALVIICLGCSLYGLVTEVHAHLRPPEDARRERLRMDAAYVAWKERQDREREELESMLASRFGEMQSLAMTSAIRAAGFEIARAPIVSAAPPS